MLQAYISCAICEIAVCGSAPLMEDAIYLAGITAESEGWHLDNGTMKAYCEKCQSKRQDRKPGIPYVIASRNFAGTWQ